MKNINNYTDKRLPFGIDPNRSYTTKEAAEEVLRCKPSALESARCAGLGPFYVYVDVPESVKPVRRLPYWRVLYPGSFLIEYMEGGTVKDTRRRWTLLTP
jgi:hypothetical protein